jgi:hypothetical protein
VPCESNYIRAESTEHATLRIDKKHVGSLVEQRLYSGPQDVRIVKSGPYRSSEALEEKPFKQYHVVI